MPATGPPLSVVRGARCGPARVWSESEGGEAGRGRVRQARGEGGEGAAFVFFFLSQCLKIT